MADDQEDLRARLQDDLMKHLLREASYFFSRPEIYGQVKDYDQESDLFLSALLTLMTRRLVEMGEKDGGLNIPRYMVSAFDAVMQLYEQEKKKPKELPKAPPAVRDESDLH